jgi:BatD DUF11 like domain
VKATFGPSWVGVAALVLLSPLVAAASGFSVRSEVDARKIGAQDQLQLTVTVEGSGGPDEIGLPPLTNLEVVGGPFQSTQISVVNGRMSQSRSYTYVLQPRGVGKAEIGAVTAGDQAAPAIPIEVVAGSIRPREQQSPTEPFATDPFGDPFEQMFGRRRGRRAAPKLLIEAQPSRTRLRVGEPLVLTYYLYTQTAVSDLQFKDAPQYAGFWVEDLERPQVSPSGEPATVGGESYRRFPVLQKLLFPTKAGTLTIPPASFRIGLAQQGFFDTGGTVERATKPVAVTVESLPDVPGFSGAVGRFRVTASLDREAVPLGEAATLRFRVEGTGNLKWIDRGPKVEMAGAKVYPPQTKSDLKPTPQGVTGSRTWEFVVVPQTTGAVEVPGLAFSYFDSASGKIATARTAPLTLRVEGGTAATAVGSAPPPALASPAASGLPLRADLDARPAGVLALGGRSLGLLVGLTLLAHAGLWGMDRVRGALVRGRGRTASPRSVWSALRDLERAGKEAASKEQAAAFVERALVEAFGELDDGDDTARTQAVRSLLDEVHFVRYAPQLGHYDDKIKDLVSRASETVRKWA